MFQPKRVVVAVGIMVFVTFGSAVVISATSETQPVPKLKTSSVWRGTCHQSGVGAYPMILFVHKRNGNAFEATSWYPTFFEKPVNGLLKVSGTVAEDGTVKFTEDERIFSSLPVLVSGASYTSTLDGDTLKGQWTSVRGSTDKFELRLAD